MTTQYENALMDSLKRHGDMPIPGLVERLSYEGLETGGDWGLYLPDRPRTVLWQGLSEDAAHVVGSFLGRRDIDARPLNAVGAAIIFGWEGLPMLSLPIAEDIDAGSDFTETHWVPLTIDIARGDRKLRRRVFKRVAFSRSDKIAAWNKSEGHCWYCGTRMNPFEDFSIDHVLPVARGGGNNPENLVPCCLPCNLQKKAMPLERFRIHRGGGLFWFERKGESQ